MPITVFASELPMYSKTADSGKMNYSDFLQNFSAPAVIFDSDFVILDANAAFLKLSHFSTEQDLQRQLTDLFRFSASEKQLADHIAQLYNGTIPSVNTRGKFTECVEPLASSEAKVLLQKIANADLLLGIFSEIEKPNHNIRPEISDEQLFKLLLNEVPDAIYFKDTKGRFFLTNRLHALKLGLGSIDELNGKSDFDLFSKEHAQQAFDDEQYVMTSGNTISKEEKETWLDGTDTWASTSKMPIKNESGIVVGTFGISKDITQIKNAEIQLRKAEKILQETNDAKDKFFSILAHDLKNPFNSLIGLSDLLVDDFNELSDEEKLNMVKKLQQTSESAYALLENLLDWSRVQTGSISMRIDLLRLKPLVKEVLEISQLHAYNKNIEIISEIPENIILRADENMLRTIIRNLVSNAIKFTMPGGKVRVVAKMNETDIVIKVQDNGVGMDEETRLKLFMISEKIKSYGTADESGTGLGLIIVREFVEKNKGHITVESLEGKGSSFILTLPIK